MITKFIHLINNIGLLPSLSKWAIYLLPIFILVLIVYVIVYYNTKSNAISIPFKKGILYTISNFFYLPLEKRSASLFCMAFLLPSGLSTSGITVVFEIVLKSFCNSFR